MNKTGVAEMMTPEEEKAFAAMVNSDLPRQEQELQSPDPIDPAALHGLAGDIVRTIEPNTEADPVAILIQFLTAFGNAAGRTAYYAVEADRHFPNLYAVLIGESAKARKGTSQGHIKAIFKQADENWFVSCQQSGLSSGEGLIWAVRNPIETQVAVKEKGHHTGDYDKLITDHGIADKRLLVVEAEFASTLRVMGRDGNTLSAVIRNGWDSGDLRIMTKNAAAVATGAHVSIIGHITADELRRYLDRTEAGNGFANRFLWVSVKRSKCLPEGGEMWREDLTSIVHGLREALDHARQTERVRFDAEAREIWRNVYPQLSEGQPGLLGAVTARQEAQAVRLALIYALIDRSSEIRRPHLLAALAVVEYVHASAAYVFGDSTGDPVADDIMRALRRSPDGMTRTDISGVFARNKSAAAIGTALTTMMKAGKVRVETLATDGRNAEVWRAS